MSSDPCPTYLKSYSAPNSYAINTNNTLNPAGAHTCFMWDPYVIGRYKAMMNDAAKRYDGNPRVEGLMLEESSLGFNGIASQDVGDGGTYTAEAWRDGLIDLINGCAAAFSNGRCISFLNFIRGGQSYVKNVSDAISAVPNDQACMSGPDLLPDSPSLFTDPSDVYQVLARHKGCRSNSAQNDSFNVQYPNKDPYTLQNIFDFAVNGTFGSFDSSAPFASGTGVCVNSYLFWNDVATKRAPNNYLWTDALPVIANNPYGSAHWYGQCSGGGVAP